MSISCPPLPTLCPHSLEPSHTTPASELPRCQAFVSGWREFTLPWSSASPPSLLLCGLFPFIITLERWPSWSSRMDWLSVLHSCNLVLSHRTHWVCGPGLGVCVSSGCDSVQVSVTASTESKVLGPQGQMCRQVHDVSYLLSYFTSTDILFGFVQRSILLQIMTQEWY